MGSLFEGATRRSTRENGMGVRFECPQGHKLHVKAHLAGQRGICPECGLRFIVPSFSGGRVAEAPAGENASRSGFVSVSMESTATFNAALAASEAGSTGSDDSTAWYVRPANGGQYGPVDTAGFQQWIAEGRVGADAWVWRTGWGEWRAGAFAVRSLGVERQRGPAQKRAAGAKPPSAPGTRPSQPAGPTASASPGPSIPATSSAPNHAASAKPRRFSEFSPELTAALEPTASSTATADFEAALPDFALGEALDELFSKPRNGEPTALMPPVMAARATRDKKSPPRNYLLTAILAVVALVLLVVLVIVLRRPPSTEPLIDDVPATSLSLVARPKNAVAG